MKKLTLAQAARELTHAMNRLPNVAAASPQAYLQTRAQQFMDAVVADITALQEQVAALRGRSGS